jgi:putative membrane protein
MRRIVPYLLGLYLVLLTIAVGTLALGGTPPPVLTPLSTVAGFVFALTHASVRMGWKRALGLLGLVFAVSLTFESVGVATGWVYGPYHYTAKLGPLFLGLVPYLIAVAWFMMMYPSFVIADWLIPSTWTHWKRLFSVAALGGLVMTAWDVVMDPLMVRGGHWIWEIDGAFFGVPLQNYWGWWLTVFVTFALFLLFTRGKSARVSDPSFDRMVVISYIFTGIGNVIAALSTGLGGPGLAGLFAMLPWMIAGWLKMSEKPAVSAETSPH